MFKLGYACYCGLIYMAVESRVNFLAFSTQLRHITRKYELAYTVAQKVSQCLINNKLY